MREEIANQSEVNGLLDHNPEGVKSIRAMTTFEFCQFGLRRLNNIRVDNYEVVNLTKFLNNYRTSTVMSDETKVDTVMRLKRLGVY